MASTMREFFQGWRRKSGCATLALTLILFGGWMRSRQWSDQFWVQTQSACYFVESSDGGIRAYWINERRRTRPYGWSSEVIHEIRVDGTYVRYSSLVLTLTALSGYLILWKTLTARPAKPDNGSNP